MDYGEAVTLRHRIRFYQQLAVLARAGVPMRSSLLRLKDRISGRQIKILEQQIAAGTPVGDAFVAAGFSSFECNLVAAGERSARLEIIYQHLAEFWDRQRQMIQALVTQLYYPIGILHVSILFGAVLQLVTGTIVGMISDLVVGFGLLYGIGIGLFLFIRSTWASDTAQNIWLRVPLIGQTLSTAYAYRWITALRIEYSAGIPLPTAVADAWNASGFVGRQRLAQEAETSLREGGELSPLIQKWRWLPRDWVDFIETGEISGALDTALENLDAEAGRSWTLAQERMSQWFPKLLSFFILLITAVYVGSLLYKTEVAPINDAMKMIDDLNK